MKMQNATDPDTERRMADAERAEEGGQYDEAIQMYASLGKDIQARYGSFHGRAIDAFEGMARAIRKASASGNE